MTESVRNRAQNHGRKMHIAYQFSCKLWCVRALKRLCAEEVAHRLVSDPPTRRLYGARNFSRGTQCFGLFRAPTKYAHTTALGLHGNFASGEDIVGGLLNPCDMTRQRSRGRSKTGLLYRGGGCRELVKSRHLKFEWLVTHHLQPFGLTIRSNARDSPCSIL